MVNNVCNTKAEKCGNQPFQPYDFDVAYLKHFITKTIEEWIGIKILRGTPDVSYETFMEKNKNRFFKYNKITDEKMKFLNGERRN